MFRKANWHIDENGASIQHEPPEPHPVRNTILVLAGIGVAGVAVWGLPKLAHKLHPHVSTGSGKPAAVPMYRAPKGKNAIAQINAVNSQYVKWVDERVHQAVPEIPATGPNAGTLTPAILNSPGVLKKWPGPKVPMSLKGIKIPASTPANGAIVGLNPTALAHYTAEAQKIWPGITESQVKAAMVTAARYVMASDGNRAMGLVPFFDSALYSGELDQELLAKRSALWNFTAPASKGGMLPLRQMFYREWITFSPPGTSVQPTIQASSISLNEPKGHVRYGNFEVNNFTVHMIGSAMSDGKVTVGEFRQTISQLVEGQVFSGRETRWYVWGAQSGYFNNTPNPILWSRP